jgi:uncharacterized damage-inducible protein DinB
MSELREITRLLKSTFRKNAWHGPALMEVLNGLTPEQAQQRLTHTHSIIELVAHMTSWRTFVYKRMEGDTEYTVSDEMNFPQVTDWPQVLQALEKSQERLLKAIETFPETKLTEIVPHGSHQYTYYILLHGIIHHDIYHTGQIMLMRKHFS